MNPTIPEQIARNRRYIRARSKPRIGILGQADGTLFHPEKGYYWARWRGSRDANGNATHGQPFPVWAGDTNYLPHAGRQVYIGIGLNGRLTVLGAVPTDLINAGFDARAHNPNDAYRQYVYTPNIVTFRSDALADEGNDSLKVNLNQLLYKDAYGDYTLWNGTDENTHLDLAAFEALLTVDQHCYAVVALKTLENETQTEASTPKSLFDPLTLADVQEAKAKLDPECIESRVYRIYYDQTTLIASPVTDWDLRQWINVPARLGNPTVITERLRVRANHQMLYYGEVQILGELQVLGEVLLLGTGGGSSGMTDFIVAADTGTPATIEDGDTLTAAGDGETTEVSLSGKTWTIATKPNAIPKVCNLRVAVDAGNGADDMIGGFTNATALSFLPWSQGGTFSLPRSGVWNYYDPGDIAGTIDYAKTGLTGNTTNTSAVITAIQNTEQLAVGMKVSGSGINAAAVINSVDSVSQITMSHAATATASGVALTFTFPADTNYDVFLKWSTIEGAVIPVYEKWVSNVIRPSGGTPLPLYDYVVVSDNSDDHRFLATIRAGASGFSKSDTDCHVSNWDNPYEHKMWYGDTTVYTYSTTTWRAWRNQAAARFSVVVQLFALMKFEFVIGTSTTSNQPLIGIGVDAIAQDSQSKGGYGSQTTVKLDARCTLTTTRSQGRHVITPIERGATGASFHGAFVPVTDNDVLAGFSGEVMS